MVNETADVNTVDIKRVCEEIVPVKNPEIPADGDIVCMADNKVGIYRTDRSKFPSRNKKNDV